MKMLFLILFSSFLLINCGSDPLNNDRVQGMIEKTLDTYEPTFVEEHKSRAKEPSSHKNQDKKSRTVSGRTHRVEKENTVSSNANTASDTARVKQRYPHPVAVYPYPKRERSNSADHVEMSEEDESYEEHCEGSDCQLESNDQEIGDDDHSQEEID
jgi:hypothetical protein